MRLPELAPLVCEIDRTAEPALIRCWAAGLLLNGQPCQQAMLNIGDRLSLGGMDFEILGGIAAALPWAAGLPSQPIKPELTPKKKKKKTPLQGQQLSPANESLAPAPGLKSPSKIVLSKTKNRPDVAQAMQKTSRPHQQSTRRKPTGSAEILLRIVLLNCRHCRNFPKRNFPRFHASPRKRKPRQRSARNTCGSAKSFALSKQNWNNGRRNWPQVKLSWPYVTKSSLRGARSWNHASPS